MNMKKMLGKDAGSKLIGVAGGAIGTNFALSKLPSSIDDKMKNGAGILVGYMLSNKKGMIGYAGLAMMATCAGNLGRQFGIGATIIGNPQTVIIKGLDADMLGGSNRNKVDPRETY